MIGQIDIRISARRPNMPLNPVFSFKGSPSSIRLMDVPQKIGTWDINRVYIKILNPDNGTSIVDCVRIGNAWVGTFLGCDVVGKVKQGIEVLADGINENGEDVDGYVLGIADYIVMDKGQNIDALIEKYNVRFLDELPANASKGDMVVHNGNVQLFDGVKWVKCSDKDVIENINGRLENLGSEVAGLNEEVGGVKNQIVQVSGSIPTKMSQLENDSGYVKNYDSALRLRRGEETNPDGYVLLEPGMLQMDSATNVTLGMYGQQANKIEMEGGGGSGGKGIILYTDETGYGYIKLNGKDIKLDIDDKIEKPETFSKGQVLTVVEVADTPSEVSTFSSRVTGTHLEWQAVDPQNVTKTSQLQNDSGFVVESEVQGLRTEITQATEIANTAQSNVNALQTTVQQNTTTLGQKADRTELPTRTSELDNDSGFVGADEVNTMLADKADKAQLPTKTSQLQNDSGYATQSYVDGQIGIVLTTEEF